MKWTSGWWPQVGGDHWSWYWAPPSPYQFGDNPFWDWVRVGAVVAAVVLMCATARVLVEGRRRRDELPATQIARFVSLALASLSLTATEIVRLGSVATPRLLVTWVVLVTGYYGIRGMRRKQRADPPIR